MPSRSRSLRRGLPLLALGLWFGCLLLPPAAGAQAAAAAGAVRTELALDNRPLSFAFDATLRASVPRPLLAGAEWVPESRIRLGELTVNPFLSIGSLDAAARREAGQPPLAGETVVWLTRADQGWALELEIVPADSAEAESTEVESAAAAPGGTGEVPGSDDGIVARIPLTREAAEPQETLSAALVPTSDDAGRLVLRWHAHRWTAAFDLLPVPTPAELAAAAAKAARAAEAERDGPRVPTDTEQLTFDSDTSAGARALALSERNETAVVLPDGSRVAVLVWQAQLADGDEFAALATLGDGEVVRLTRAAVMRLRNEVPLRFGDTPIPTENLAPDFAGSYGLWLKRAGDGWRLVFNHEADSWGTQHDPAFDAAEIDLVHSQDGLATRPLGAVLVPVTAHSGRLVIHWGAHEWTADYTIPDPEH